MKNLVVIFIFSVLDRKYPFFLNLLHKSKFFVEAVI